MLRSRFAPAAGQQHGGRGVDGDSLLALHQRTAATPASASSSHLSTGDQSKRRDPEQLQSIVGLRAQAALCNDAGAQAVQAEQTHTAHST